MKSEEMKDTKRLLELCDKGIKMGVSAIDDGLKYAKGAELRDALLRCKKTHEALESDFSKLLSNLHLKGKSPSLMTTMMTFVSIRTRLYFNHKDEDIISLMEKGCQMGIKSLETELIKRQKAKSKSRELCGRLILLERDLLGKLSQLS